MNWFRHDFSSACLLHESNCNQCALGHNSCRRQFTKAKAFNSSNRKVAIHCVFSVKDNTLSFAQLLNIANGQIKPLFAAQFATYHIPFAIKVQREYIALGASKHITSRSELVLVHIFFASLFIKLVIK